VFLASTAGAALLAAFVAVVIVGAIIAPLGPSLHDPDAAASVLFFHRIAARQHLEAFVPTTPKPILTLLYGAAWNVVGDWRALGLLTLVAFAVAVAAATAMALRTAGRAAAVFVAVALITSSSVALEVAHANSLIWGLAGWAIAGLAVTGGPRRSWIAGLALAGAASFRTETFVLVGIATLGCAVLAVRPGGGGRGAMARWSGILLGWLAVPLALVHDLLLTGDPLSWLRVPAGYTALTTPGLGRTPPLEFAADLVVRYVGQPVLVALAVIGIVWLVQRGLVALAAGFVGLTVGIAILIGFVAWPGIYVTPRYFEQVDLGLIGAASIGAGAVGAGLRRVAARAAGGSRAEAFGLVVAGALAVAVTVPTAIFDTDLGRRLAEERAQSGNVERVRPILQAALGQAGSAVPAAVAGPMGLWIVDPAAATLVVPRPLWTRLAVELDSPLTRLADSWLMFRDHGVLESVRPGQTVYHDAADTPPALYEPLETHVAAAVDGIRLVPALADPARGIWVIVIEPRP
jgi:hypothetical protein